MSFKVIIITYLVGGLTFIPLLVIAFIYISAKTLPRYEENKVEQDDSSSSGFEKDLKLTELNERETSGVKAYMTGWMYVTKEFTLLASLEASTVETTTKSNTYNSLMKFVKKEQKEQTEQTTTVEQQPTTTEKPSSSSSNLNSKKPRKNRFFGVLRHGNLFLYKDESQKDVQHVIVLSNHIVTMWPRNLKDASLFTKQSAICLIKKNDQTSDILKLYLNSNSDDIVQQINQNAFFIYPETNFQKEDWYFELIKATKIENFTAKNNELDLVESSLYANPLHFKTSDMMELIQTLHSSEGQLHTRWLNALIGRLFLSLQQTKFFESIVRTKLLKKLAKINKPGFLEEFKIQNIHVGNSAPFISFPKLNELNPDGTLKISMKFSYTGKLSLQVATKANINLGTHFKTREVSLLLAVTLNKIEGPLIVMVKPPPSSRIWYTFESQPDVDLTIEPVVSQRQITYGLITKPIENKFRDAINSSLVFPAWDDISFFDTSDEFFRGGIWEDSKAPVDSELQGMEDELDIDDDQISSVSTGTKINQSSIKSRNLNSKASNSDISVHSNAESSGMESLELNDLNGNDDSFNEGSSNSNPNSKFSKSSTFQSISEEAAASKKTISNSIKKFGKWYSEKSTKIKSNEKAYAPPEMIQNRKPRTNSNSNLNPNSNSINSRSLSISTSASLESENSTASSPSLNKKTAPQAHTFPAEYLYGLQGQTPDMNDTAQHVHVPSRIPDMKSPYLQSDNKFEEAIISPTSPKRHVSFPKRKPVTENESLNPAAASTSTLTESNEPDAKDPAEIVKKAATETTQEVQEAPTEEAEKEEIEQVKESLIESEVDPAVGAQPQTLTTSTITTTGGHEAPNTSTTTTTTTTTTGTTTTTSTSALPIEPQVVDSTSTSTSPTESQVESTSTSTQFPPPPPPPRRLNSSTSAKSLSSPTRLHNIPPPLPQR